MNQYRAEKTEQRNKRYRTGLIALNGMCCFITGNIALTGLLGFGVSVVFGLVSLSCLVMALLLVGEP